MNGIIIINKPRGFTSHDVVAKLRGILKTKKIGHTGTLDPEAEGVLPVCIGSATKVCDFLMNQPKEYVAEVLLGTVTDTQDIFGTIIKTFPVSVTEVQLRAAIAAHTGRISQLTPMYSARKVNGRKLYDLARQGVTVERTTKSVTIYEIELLSFDLVQGIFSMRVRCEKGTYIRTLCNDIGEMLGCGACMTSLVRTSTGGFALSDAHTLNEVQAAAANNYAEQMLISVDSLFPQFASCEVSDHGYERLRNGNPLDCMELQCDESLTDTIRMYHHGEFYALYTRKGTRYVPLQMFLPEGAKKTQ